MKFRISPLTRSMFIVWFALMGAFSIAFIWMMINYPNSRMAMFIMLCVSGSGILMVYVERKKAFSIISFDTIGITSKCILSKDIHISWDECADIGIARHNQGGWASIYWIYWIYFSKDRMTDKQMKQPQAIINNEYIRLQFSDELLDEVLKYIDKDRIKNLYLIKSK